MISALLLLACTPGGAPGTASTVDDSDLPADSGLTADSGLPEDTDAACPAGDWVLSGGQLCHQGAPARPIGANAMHVFGPGSADMAEAGLVLAREFIGNMSEQPLEGWAIQDSRGSWLHPLRDVVEDNRSHGLVTLLSPMGWDGEEALLGKEPSEVDWGPAYVERLQSVAALFAGERDVWLSVWNEPYAWTGEGFSEDRWQADMQGLVNAVRDTGFDGILVVPGSHMGQGAAVLASHGPLLEDPQQSLLFDLHAYERWLLERSAEEADAELSALDEAGIAWMIGEIAPMNAGTLMDPRPFLALPRVLRRPAAAWLWKYSDTDTDALRTADGALNDRDNNAWGSTWAAHAASTPP